MNKYFATFCFSIAFLLAHTQTTPNLFDFDPANDIKVFAGNDSLTHAWAGGLNYVQVSKIDMDLDGTEDLLVYDRMGGKAVTFLAVTSGSSSYYKFAPEYIAKFPKAGTWMLARDYNCDGKKDLFFSDPGQTSYMRVYKNVSVDSLEFSNQTSSSLLQTKYPSGLSSFYVGSTSIPVIDDINGDGKIDILTFGLGSFRVEWHSAQTQCGLNIEQEENCWGHFMEGGLKQTAQLNACTPQKKKTMHEGSSMLTLDLDGDGVKDLLLSNLSYPNVTALYNTGSPDSAHFTSQDTLFPAYDESIDLYIFPSLFYEDIDFDGVPDLIAGIAEQAQQLSNKRSIWTYHNTGTTATPVFDLTQKDFLQRDMIDLGEGAVPRLADLNGDSLLDLVISNYGEFKRSDSLYHYYAYYENTGTATDPEFTLVDSNFADISQYTGLTLGTIPCFGDLDNDGDLDMLIGDEAGFIHLFTNTGSASAPAFSLTTAAFQNIDVGVAAAPFLYDLDSDGDLDLLIGNSQGTISYYTNSSATAPNFTLQNDYFGAIDTRAYGPGSKGSSIPYIFEHNGKANLLVGQEYGGINQYDSLGIVQQQPSLMTGTVGNGTLYSQSYYESPFPITKKAFRSQFLIRASEMKAEGLDFGYLNNIQLYANFNSTTLVFHLTVKVKHTTDSVLNSFAGNMDVVINNKQRTVGPGWINIDFDEPYWWDGTSNLVFEICYYGQQPYNGYPKIQMTDVGYNSYAYGDITGYDNFTANSSCDMPYLNSLTQRPNVKFNITAALSFSKTYYDGYRTSAAAADLDSDGYPDMIVGNYSGGVNYYHGKKYVVGLEENPMVTRPDILEIYPNPGNGTFTVKTEGMGNALLQVFDLTGRKVTEKSVKSSTTDVDISNQASGIYLFILSDGKKLQKQKVIKY